MNELLNNREQAAAVWTVLAIVAAAIKIPEARVTAWAVVKQLLTPPLGYIFGLSIAYAVAMALLLRAVGIWYAHAPTDVVVWYFVVGAVLIGTSVRAAGRAGYFSGVVRRSIGWTVVVEFVANLYVFPLLVELVLVPTVALILTLEVVAERNPEFASARKLLGGLSAVFGLFLLSYAVATAVGDPGGLLAIETADELVLPALLTIMFIPCVYVVALYSAYEQVLMRLEGGDVHARHRWRAGKRRLVRACGINLGRISRFRTQTARLPFMKDEAEFQRAIDAFERRERARRDGGG